MGQRIVNLRQRLGLSQAGLGTRMHYSPMAVSRWERGAKEPPAQCWIQLGNLAGAAECWAFWSRAGLRRADIFRALAKDRSLRKVTFQDLDVVIARSELGGLASVVALSRSQASDYGRA